MNWLHLDYDSELARAYLSLELVPFKLPSGDSLYYAVIRLNGSVFTVTELSGEAPAGAFFVEGLVPLDLCLEEISSELV